MSRAGVAVACASTGHGVEAAVLAELDALRARVGALEERDRRVTELVREIDALTARVGTVEHTCEAIRAAQARRHGPRDTEDRALLRALHAGSEALPFRCRDVCVRARVIPALAAALRRADVDGSQQLGKWLARMHGVEIDGLVVIRGRSGTRAALWQIAMCAR